MNRFADRLCAAIKQKGNPVMVGLDPRWAQLPPQLKTSSALIDYLVFCKGIIDVVAPLVPAIKPQSAFFEALGPPGMAVLGEIIVYSQQKGLLVVLDVKRNDIGSTAQAYAEGLLGPEQSAWGADAITVNPYLGEDSLEPFVQQAEQTGAGLFVLVKTSNPGGAKFQDQILRDTGLPIYRFVADYVERLAAGRPGADGFGDIGAVVGATYPAQLAELRLAMPHVLLLIPGYGSQGGAAQDVMAGFRQDGLGAIVNNARNIIFAYARKPYAEQFGAARWQEATEAATRSMIAELRAATTQLTT